MGPVRRVGGPGEAVNVACWHQARSMSPGRQPHSNPHRSPLLLRATPPPPSRPCRPRPPQGCNVMGSVPVAHPQEGERRPEFFTSSRRRASVLARTKPATGLLHRLQAGRGLLDDDRDDQRASRSVARTAIANSSDRRSGLCHPLYRASNPAGTGPDSPTGGLGRHPQRQHDPPHDLMLPFR